MTDLNHPLPRSAYVFSAEKAPWHPLFTPTHRRIETDSPVQLISQPVYTYPTAYPGVLIMDETGTLFFILEEVWDQRNKKKQLVNYVPLE